MVKTIVIVTICAALSISAIFLLHTISHEKNFKKGGFRRIFHPAGISLSGAYDLKEHSYYIAGVTSENIFLGNQKTTSKMIILSHDFKDFRQINLDISPYKISWMGAKIKIDSPFVFITESVTPSILHGYWNPFKVIPYRVDSMYYSEALPISFSSFVLKAYDKGLRRDILVKKQSDSPYTKSAKEVLEKQIDGRFCEDGVLLYSRDLGRLIYIYYYRNQFMTLDTNLNLIYKRNTIDTNRYAKIKVERVNSAMSITLSTPHLFVNKNACIAYNHIFINSTQFSDTDDKKMFFLSSVIDVYDLSDGHYEYSFYLPKVHDSKMISFCIFKNRLIASYENHYVATFQINFKI